MKIRERPQSSRIRDATDPTARQAPSSRLRLSGGLREKEDARDGEATQAAKKAYSIGKRGTKEAAKLAGASLVALDQAEAKDFRHAWEQERRATGRASRPQQGRQPQQAASPRLPAAQPIGALETPAQAKRRLQIKRAYDTRQRTQAARQAEARTNASSLSRGASQAPAPVTHSAPAQLPATPARKTKGQQGRQLDPRSKRLHMAGNTRQSIKTRPGSGSSPFRQTLNTRTPLPTGRNQVVKNPLTRTPQEQAREHFVQKARANAKKAGQSVRKVAASVAKAVVAVAKGLGAVLGGTFLLVGLVVVMCIVAVLASPFGIFFSGQDVGSGSRPLSVIVAELDAELESSIQKIIDSNSHDTLEMVYNGSVDGVRINNWPDVVAVFAVATTTDPENGMDVVTLDDARVALLRKVFQDMNTVDYSVERVSSDDPEEPSEKVLTITVISRTATEQADAYGFNEDQREMLRELLSAEYRPMLLALLGISVGGGYAPDLDDILSGLPTGDIGGRALAAAATRLGDPYSIPLAGYDRFVDCSLLTQWAYSYAGVSISRNASAQARAIDEAGRRLTKAELRPGDLVFWSYGPNGNYLEIGHVGFYVGDGLVLHASSVDMQVVIEPLFHEHLVVMYGRPY